MQLEWFFSCLFSLIALFILFWVESDKLVVDKVCRPGRKSIRASFSLFDVFRYHVIQQNESLWHSRIGLIVRLLFYLSLTLWFFFRILSKQADFGYFIVALSLFVFESSLRFFHELEKNGEQNILQLKSFNHFFINIMLVLPFILMLEAFGERDSFLEDIVLFCFLMPSMIGHLYLNGPVKISFSFLSGLPLVGLSLFPIRYLFNVLPRHWAPFSTLSLVTCVGLLLFLLTHYILIQLSRSSGFLSIVNGKKYSLQFISFGFLVYLSYYGWRFGRYL